MTRLLAPVLMCLMCAQDDLAPIQNGKRATGLVVNPVQAGSGSAFCIDASGVFVTNAHVVRGVALNQDVKLFLNCGEKDEKEHSARVIRLGNADESGQKDFAILQIENPGGARFPALELGDADKLVETSALTAFGYPFGEALATDKTRRPNISVSTGRVTSLRKDQGKLELIQLDASVNPGNSGGPLLDKSGKVVGVIWAGVRGAAINFAVPSGALKLFVQEPVVTFQPPALAAKDRSKPVTLTVRVVDILPPDGPTSVDIVVGEGASQRTVAATESGKGSFSAQLVPFPEKPKAATQVPVTVEFKNGQIVGLLENQSLRVGAEAFKLSDVQSVDVAARKLTLASGPVKDGYTLALPQPDIDLGGQTVKLDTSKIVRLTVSAPPPSGESELACRAVVRRRSKVLKEVAAALRIDAPEEPATPAAVRNDASGPSAPAPIKPAEGLGEGPVERPLPGVVDDVVAGGNGRYLAILMRNLKKVALFDATTGKVERYVTMPGDTWISVAGAEKLVLVNTDQNIVQRFKLATGEKEFTGKLPITGVVKAVVMGHNAKNTMMVHWAVGTDALAQGKYDLVNIDTMRVVENDKFQARNGHSYRDFMHLRASADGTTYSQWCTSHSPSGLESMVLVGKKMTDYYEHDSVGHVIPSADGKYVLTGRGIYTSQLKKRGGDRLNIFSIPSTSASWHLGLDAAIFGRSEAKKSRRVDIYVMGQESPLLGIDAPEMAGGEGDAWARTDFTQDKRYWFIPSAELLVTVPATNDRLVLRRINILQQLDKQGIDYLFVVSSPHTGARKGQRYEYQLEVKAKRAVSKYSVDGPPGMTISPSGKISWTVPASGEKEVAVVVTIKDATGQETFHTYTISVE